MKSKRPVDSAARVLACLLGLAAASAWAQAPANTGNGLDNPDWKEEQAAPPPVFSQDGLIALDMPNYVSLKMGVDPATIVVGSDGVVRYVIVMKNTSGSVNAVYEGIRCASDEVKTYARWSASGSWSVTSNPQWKAVNDNMPSRHAQAFARQGGCQNRLAPTKVAILQALKTGSKAGAPVVVY